MKGSCSSVLGCVIALALFKQHIVTLVGVGRLHVRQRMMTVFDANRLGFDKSVSFENYSTQTVAKLTQLIS